MSKDVLIVHAAGNNGENIDVEPNFPNPRYADNSGTAEAWLEVGASGSKDDSTLVVNFSNYGKKSVDVFAPGVGIIQLFLEINMKVLMAPVWLRQ